jgi:hypothetical protein
VLLHGVRLLRQPGAIVAGLSLVVAASLSYLGGGSGECSAGKAPGAFGAFVCYAPAPFVFLVPAAAALVGGVLVASSRARGEDVVYAVRGLAGTRLTLARVLAGSFAAGSVVLLAGLVLVALALVLLPHRPELDRPPGVGVIPGFRPPEPGLPLPVLWRDAPLVGDLLAAVVYALAAAALAALGNAVGQLLAQPVAAFAAPVLLVLATQVAPLPGLGRWISGYAYLDLMPIHGTMTDLPGALRLPAILAYWLALLVAAVALALAAARRQEARA